MNSIIDESNHWEHVFKECVIPSPCWMMAKSDFDKIGGFENSDYPEDYDLVFRMYLNHYKVLGVKKILHLWRDHKNRVSRNSEHYKEQHFFKLKVKYLLKHFSNEKLTWSVIGAGKKGKVLVKILQEKNELINWLSSNRKKIGKIIYGLEILDFEKLHIEANTNTKFLIAVSSPEENAVIYKHLIINGLEANLGFVNLF